MQSPRITMRRWWPPSPRPWMRTPGAVLIIASTALVSARTEATPSFARKYNVSCTSCHAEAYPELNALGREFKERGYQFPEGAEIAYRDQDTLSPGTIDERIGLLRELPLAARAVGAAQVPTHPRASNRNNVDLKLLEDVFLILGGALYKDVSLFVSASMAPRPVLHHGSVGVHNLLGDGALNVRAGEFLLLDFVQPGHRSLGRASNLGANTTVGLNPTALDSSQLGLDIFGRFFGRRLFYELAIVQGAKGPDGLSDLDSNKDVFGQLSFTIHDQNILGVLGYYGRTQITDEARSVQVRFTDPFFIVGGEAEFRVGPARFFGYGLYGRHQNPTGNGAHVSYVGARGDVTVSITRELFARLRYDSVTSHDDHSLERRVLSTQASYLLLTNFKISAEFGADMGSFDRSTMYLSFDIAL